MTERMEHKSREEFEALTYEDVLARAAMTDACAQLASEMEAIGAAAIGELPQLRVDVFYHSTGAVYADITPGLLGRAMKDPDLTKAKQPPDEAEEPEAEE